ncbi:EamA family transporter [Photobacterium halotolerans]|uniref:DMT family transporter n=1 Tax=Photobacterium halotolerans TaxID=265726 RepID=UPI001372B4F6|nr:DMT family transporter [Photobacterium halotolerans]NAX45399.1 EamA family transporter [Photobacterium halotolerans]
MLNPNYKASAILVLTTMLAAIGWIFSKETLQGLPPFLFIGMRFLLASLCLLPFCYAALRRTTLKTISFAALVGVLLGVAMMCWIHAMSNTEALAEGAFIASLSMLFVPVVAWVLFRQKPPRSFWISMPVAVAGMALLSLSGGWQQSDSQIWFAACAFMLAIHFNVNSRFAQQIPILLLACIQLFVTGLLSLTMSLTVEQIPAQVPASVWGWFALSTLLATSLRYVLQTVGQKQITASNAALIMLLEPVWTATLSVLWYDEVFTLNKALGCALILSSLVLYRVGSRPFRAARRVARIERGPDSFIDASAETQACTKKSDE